jgi:antitoxin HicB
MKKDLQYYLSLNYPVSCKEAPDAGAFVAWIPDLRGCVTQGDTAQEAMELIQEAKELWLEVALDQNEQISEPIDEREFSGKTSLRMTRTLHRMLVVQARYEGVSLNHYIVHLLERGCVGVEIKTGLRVEMRRLGSALDHSSVDLAGGSKDTSKAWRSEPSAADSVVVN